MENVLQHIASRSIDSKRDQRILFVVRIAEHLFANPNFVELTFFTFEIG